MQKDLQRQVAGRIPARRRSSARGRGTASKQAQWTLQGSPQAQTIKWYYIVPTCCTGRRLTETLTHRRLSWFPTSVKSCGTQLKFLFAEAHAWPSSMRDSSRPRSLRQPAHQGTGPLKALSLQLRTEKGGQRWGYEKPWLGSGGPCLL